MASSVVVSSEGALESGGSGRPRGEPGGEQERLLRRGELLALGNHLKEALETYSAALRLGPPEGPHRLETLVDCLVLNYRFRQGLDGSRGQAARGEGGGSAAGPLTCCGCRGFLGEPVTARCGHSYCRLCLRRKLRSRCRLCRDLLLPAGPPQLRTSVVLSQLAEKWFPAECERARTGSRLGELLSQGCFRESLNAASQALQADPSDLMLRIYRAESYAGLQEFKTAIEELNVILSKMPNWPERNSACEQSVSN